MYSGALTTPNLDGESQFSQILLYSNYVNSKNYVHHTLHFVYSLKQYLAYGNVSAH